MIVQFENTKIKNLRQLSSCLRKELNSGEKIYGIAETGAEITDYLSKRLRYLTLRSSTTIVVQLTVRFVLIGKERVEQASLTASYKYLLKLFGGESNVLYANTRADDFEQTLVLFILPIKDGVLSYSAMFRDINKSSVIQSLTLFAQNPISVHKPSYSKIPEWVKEQFPAFDFEDESTPDEEPDSYELRELYS